MSYHEHSESYGGLQNNTGRQYNSIRSAGTPIRTSTDQSYYSTITADNLTSIQLSRVNTSIRPVQVVARIPRATGTRSENDYAVTLPEEVSPTLTDHSTSENDFLQSKESLMKALASLKDKLTKFEADVSNLLKLSSQQEQETTNTDLVTKFVESARKISELVSSWHNVLEYSLRSENSHSLSLSIFMNWLDNYARVYSWFEWIDYILDCFKFHKSQLSEEDWKDFSSYVEKIQSLRELLELKEVIDNPTQLEFPVSKSRVLEEMKKKTGTEKLCEMKSKLIEKLKRDGNTMQESDILSQIWKNFEETLQMQEQKYSTFFDNRSVSLIELVEYLNKLLAIETHIQYMKTFVGRLLFKLEAPQDENNQNGADFNSLQDVLQEVMEKTCKFAECYISKQRYLPDPNRAENVANTADNHRNRASSSVSFNIENDALSSTQLASTPEYSPSTPPTDISEA